ncbi:MAG: hypothetical protein WCC21_14305 [Candidatus Acidiferrales bacterium]
MHWTLRLVVPATISIASFAASSKAAPQKSPSTQSSAAANSGGKQSTSELESAVSQFSRREEDLPKGPTPRMADGHPDLSGYWVASTKDKPVGNLGKDLPGYRLPFTPAGRTALKYNIEHTIDPESLCVVGGIPRHDASALPFQLLEGADHVAFLYWYTTYRLIPTDGRKHTDDPDPSFFGEEVGAWDGDALVIDSIAFKQARTWADENANPHSDQMHTIERWTRPDAGHLHLELSVIDPKFYTEPVHYQRTWLLGAPGQQVQEYSCAEENVDAPHLQPGPGPIGPDGQRGFEKLAPLPPPPDKDHPAKTSIPD